MATVASRGDSGWIPLPWLATANTDEVQRQPSSLFCGAPLPDEALTILFRFSGIARRYVELPAKRATRKGWTVPDVPATEHQRLKVYDRVKQAITWARLYGGGPVLMVTEDDLPRAFRKSGGGDPRQWLLQPLDLRRVGKLVALHAFDAYQATPLRMGGSPFREGFREPTHWQLSSPEWYGTVHASRVAWFRGNERPPSQSDTVSGLNVMPDDSVLQVGWVALERLARTMDSGAELADGFREAIVKISNLAKKATGDEAAALHARLRLMDEFRRVSGLTVLGDGDEYESRTHSPAGFEALADSQARMLAADLGWPQRLLYGDGPGGLSTNDEGAAEQERQIVSECQEDHRGPIEQIYRVLYASQDGPTKGREPEEWELTFSALDEPDEATLAETRHKVAETDKLYLEAGVLRAEELTAARFGAEGWRFELPAMSAPEPKPVATEEPTPGRDVPGATEGDDEEDPLSEGEEENEDSARLDANGGGCFVTAPAPEVPLELRLAVEQALGQPMNRPSLAPHVTILFVGERVRPRALGEVIEVVEEEAAEMEPGVLSGAIVRDFPEGERGVPIVLELQDGWAAAWLHERLLRRLAHRITQRQHRRFRAHVTLGYAARAPSTEARAALLGVDGSAYRVPLSELEVRSEGEVKARVVVGS